MFGTIQHLNKSLTMLNLSVCRSVLQQLLPVRAALCSAPAPSILKGVGSIPLIHLGTCESSASKIPNCPSLLDPNVYNRPDSR